MRQAGVIAAAGLYAIEHNIHRLADDHENAKTLAEGLANISGIRIDASAVQTNIVFFDVTAVTAPEFVRRLKMEGVLMGGTKREEMVVCSWCFGHNAFSPVPGLLRRLLGHADSRRDQPERVGGRHPADALRDREGARVTAADTELDV